MGTVQRPTGVAILAILGFIGAAFDILGGLLASAVLSSLFSTFAGSMGATIGALIGIPLVIVGLIALLFSWGLWSGQNWARILYIIFYALGALGSLLITVLGGYYFVVPLIIFIILIYYLTRPGVAAYFKRGAMPTQPPVSQPMSR